MDELNKRVLSVMQAKDLSKSAFANILDISLPVLTHIGSGRNKPGLELIQKIISNFRDISPDWLILGEGTMFREKLKKVDLSPELNDLAKLSQNITQIDQNAAQILEYHQILLKEILYLKELNPHLLSIQQETKSITEQLDNCKAQIKSKLSE